jgi:hypothetical protein
VDAGTLRFCMKLADALFAPRANGVVAVDGLVILREET